MTSTTTLTFTLTFCIADDFALVSQLVCASDTVNITVLTAPRPPPPPGLAANAGGDQLVSPGSVVTLSGAVTLDGGPPDETLTYTYRWQQTSGTEVNLQNDTLPTAGFRAPENAGAINLVLEFQLTVTETGTASRTATDTVRVEVLPATAGGQGQTGTGLTPGGDQSYFLIPMPFLNALSGCPPAAKWSSGQAYPTGQTARQPAPGSSRWCPPARGRCPIRTRSGD